MTVGGYDLYRYLPSYIQFVDENTNTDPDDGRPVLKKLVELIEEEASAASILIGDLIRNLDVDHCDILYVDYLAWLLGEAIPGEWADSDRRNFLRVLADLIKLKGTHPGFEKRAAFAGEKRARLVELFKHELYEQFTYSREQDVVHTIRAARVDVARVVCADSCESICEYDQELDFLSPEQGEALIDEIGEVLPIHVLVRKVAIPVDISSEHFFPLDTIGGCISSCEYYCEYECQATEQPYGGSECQGTFTDLFPVARDTFQVTTVCTDECESWCQTCCECGFIQVPCETTCEVTCQVACEDICQSDCMTEGCQSACQDGACQEMCQMWCQEVCESICEPRVEQYAGGGFPPP